MNILNFTKTVMGNLFSRPATRNYPAVPRKYPERTRGKIDIEIDSCIFCGLCSKKCPTGAITIDRPEKSWTIERFDCIQCGYCVESCPKKCLRMEQDYPEPSGEKYRDSRTQPDKATVLQSEKQEESHHA